MTKEKISKTRKKIHGIYEENEYKSVKAIQKRARSITVGTAFGGIVEVTLRADDDFLYAQIQPTEVIELIEQLAAGVGVEVAMKPKVNFASWRGWEEVIDQRIGWDRIAWKGAAAWQLGGDQLEMNIQKALGSAEPEEQKLLPDSKQESIEETPKNATKKSRKTKKKEELSDNI
jgi:hypothetical protein